MRNCDKGPQQEEGGEPQPSKIAPSAEGRVSDKHTSWGEGGHLQTTSLFCFVLRRKKGEVLLN